MTRLYHDHPQQFITSPGSAVGLAVLSQLIIEVGTPISDEISDEYCVPVDGSIQLGFLFLNDHSTGLDCPFHI